MEWHHRDLTGMRFGILVVVGPSTERVGRGTKSWACLCDCGKEKIIEGYRLFNGYAQSCSRGCSSVESLERINLYNSGKKKYIGKECKKCHGVERFTKNDSCVMCISVTAKMSSYRNVSGMPDLYNTPTICPLCEKPPDGRGMMIDHCHRTNKFRTFACGTCNSMMGMSRDDPSTLRRAADVIEQFKANSYIEDKVSSCYN